MIEAATNRGPLEVEATRVEASNIFVVGDLVALTSSGWVLADRGDVTKVADGLVVAASPDSFLVITGAGAVVRWPGHGRGSAGDLLWLDSVGETTVTPPSGTLTRVRQLVLKVLDDDNVLLFPQQAYTLP